MLPLIFQLILLNNKDKLRNYLNANPDDVNSRHDGTTTLCFAIQYECDITFDVLWDYGADPRSSDREIQTPAGNNALICSIIHGNVHCCKTLLTHGVRLEDEAMNEMLSTVFYRDYDEILMAMSYYYPTILHNSCFLGFNNDLPLQFAVRSKAHKCLKLLLLFNHSAHTVFHSVGSPFSLAIELLDYQAFKIILSDPQVKAVLVNIFGGIVKCDVIAQGILAAIEQVHVTIPVVVRLEGTNVEEGRALLTNTGLNLYAADDLSHAAEQVVALAKVAA